MSRAPAPRPARTELAVNGTTHEVTVQPWRTLCDTLRLDLRLTGTTTGCAEGVCGSCTVLVDDEPVRSCTVLARQVDGRQVETVESLASPGELNRLQRAFRRHGALQCGFCTPGFLMLATALLRRHPAPTREQARAWLDANLCRCTGYEPIVDAVLAAAAETAAEAATTRTGDAS